MMTAPYTETEDAAGTVAARTEALSPPPRTVAESGLDTRLIVDLAAKFLLLRGRLSTDALSREIRLPLSVLGEALAFMRAERLVEVVRHEGLEPSVVYQLSELGRMLANDAHARCRYAGPAPVTLQAYSEMIELHSIKRATINRNFIRNAFRDMIAPLAIVDQIGAAMNSGRAILLHGPAGSGKTFLAEHLAPLQPGSILVPYAVTVGGEIIQIYDPLVHKPVREPDETRGAVSRDRDARWIHCRRPMIIAGGELNLQMLDLQFEPALRFYQAPPHLKANGGLFVVDDLGRQLVAPQDLMNRWIVPLDRRRDYLSLHTGFKFSIPFDLTVIFSTNLPPHSIADEALLRRFGYKVHLGPVDRDTYRRLFERSCAETGVVFDGKAVDWLIAERHAAERRPLLACYPADLVGRVRDFALYDEREPRLTDESLGHAWSTYFFGSGPNESAWDPASRGNDILHGELS